MLKKLFDVYVTDPNKNTINQQGLEKLVKDFLYVIVQVAPQNIEMYIDKTIKRVIIRYLKFLQIVPTTVKEKIFQTIKGRDRVNNIRSSNTKYNPILALRNIKGAFSKKSGINELSPMATTYSNTTPNTYTPTTTTNNNSIKNRFRLPVNQAPLYRNSNPDLYNDSIIAIDDSITKKLPYKSKSVSVTQLANNGVITNTTSSPIYQKNPSPQYQHNKFNDVDNIIAETLTYSLQLERDDIDILSTNSIVNNKQRTSTSTSSTLASQQHRHQQHHPNDSRNRSIYIDPANIISNINIHIDFKDSYGTSMTYDPILSSM